MARRGTILDIAPAGGAEERDLLEAMGHRVMICPGPGDDGRCPLAEDGSCAVVDAADGVVFRLDLDYPYHRQMLRCYRSELGDATPLHVVVRPGQQQRHAGLLEGMSVSVGDVGGALHGFSSQVAMASAARIALVDQADPTRRSAALPGSRGR